MILRYVQSDGKKFIRHIDDNEPTRWDERTRCYARRLTPEQVKQFGVSPLQLVTPPPFDPATQRREEGPALLINGVWTQNYIVSALEDAEAAAKTEAQWVVIRGERDAKLVASDWTQLPDAPVDAAAWTEYRQTLRDITEQADPFNIVWPAEPGA